LSPPPSTSISIEAPQTGAFVDFERLTRLQQLMVEIRTPLKARFPTLPRGSRIAQNYLPLNATYALGGSNALQVWYGDTTLRWVSSNEESSLPDPTLRTIVEFQPEQPRAIALVDPPAMRALIRGNAYID